MYIPPVCARIQWQLLAGLRIPVMRILRPVSPSVVRAGGRPVTERYVQEPTAG